MNNRTLLKYEDLKKNKDDCMRLIVGVVLVLSVILYNFVWLNKSFTLSEGWSEFYIGLINEGKLPYKDFYYFLPIFNLCIDYVFWKLSFGYFIIFRCLRLTERVLITLIMYKLLNRKIASELAAIISFLGAIIASGNIYDLNGDYNQTVQLLIVLLSCFLIKYFDTRKYKWLFVSGIVGGLMFGTKQTIVLSSAIVFALMFISLSVLKEEKNILKDLLIVMLGALIPLALIGTYLLITGSLKDYIYYVFQDTGSKGSFLDIVVLSQIKLVKNKFKASIAIATIIFRKILSDFFEQKKYTKFLKRMSIWLMLFWLYGLYGYRIKNAFINDFNYFNYIVFIVAIILIIFGSDKKWFFTTIVYIYSFLLVLNIDGNTETIYDFDIFSLIVESMTLVYIYMVMWVLYIFIKALIKRESIELDKYVLACGTIASAYSTTMATGGPSVSSIIAFIAIPAFFYIEDCFKGIRLFDFESRKMISVVIKVITFALFSLCLSQKLVCSYSWWGCAQASYWDKTYVSNIECLKGFKFSHEEYEKYDKLYELIKNNTNQESIIYSFPYAKVYNIFLNNYNTVTFAPIEFYDVCPDDVAIMDAEALSEREPDIVIWLDMPSCMEKHEKYYRGGNLLGQREIQKWFSDVQHTDYALIGQVDNIFVYKLIDGNEITSTYIKRKTKPNVTANSDIPASEEMICELVGEGSLEKPYLINSCEDLIYFRDLVNEGYDFSGKYVRQTQDIDMKDCSNWVPIGCYSEGQGFAGNYDGNGYIINNLYVDANENAGMFGLLTGSVVNVVIKDCSICADYVGGIASYGKEARVVNCIVTGSINGTRVGGIADNIDGYIGNCITDVNLSGGMVSGISGYYLNEIENCFSNYGNEISVDDGYSFSDEAVNKLNDYVNEHNEQYDMLLNSWQYICGEVMLEHKN